MPLTADTHVHSEWSWDTGGPAAHPGRMEQTCARAVRIGLPALAFTDHFDFSPFRVAAADVQDSWRHLVDADLELWPTPLDVDGYFDCVERCRARFPDLRILTGVEFGQPHRDLAAAERLVDLSRFDRVNGSLHTLWWQGQTYEPFTLYHLLPAAEVVRAYLAEVPVMMSSPAPFQVFTHLDYAVRYWPLAEAGPFDPADFEEELRAALRSVAASGRALELNVAGQLRPWIPQWWREEGGTAVSFGSDAHEPDRLAQNFPEAMAMAAHLGFRPGRRPEDLWTC